MVYDAVSLDNGDVIYFSEISQVNNADEGPVQASVSDIIRKVGIDLKSEAMKVGCFVKDMRQGVIDSLDENQPSSVEIEIGLNVSQSLGCMLVESTLTSQIKMKVVWKNDGNV